MAASPHRRYYCSKVTAVNVEFVLGRKPSGEFTRVSFEARIDHTPREFEFSIKAHHLGQNIHQILKQYAEVEAIHIVDFIGQTTLEIGSVNTYLDARVLLYKSGDVVNWTARTKATTPNLGKRLVARHEIILHAARPVIAGTARAILPELKEKARQVVRERAEYRARTMIANGEALLTYLERPL